MAPKTTLETSGAVAHLVLDDPEAKLNTLGAAMIAELKERFAALKSDAAVRAVVVRSAKPGGFLAGADLRELKALSEAADAAQAGYRAAREGQGLMDLVEDLGKPVVAAVHGAALGGGCELALACTARVLAEEGASVGLPETQLGILPGFGGTWRLPRLLTLPAALPAILTGAPFDPRRALKAGLADTLAPLPRLVQVAEELALSLARPGAPERAARVRRARIPRMNRVLDSAPLRSLALSKARKDVLAKTKGRYPAPLKVLALLGDRSGGRAAYLEREARALGELLATDVSRNLVRIFFLGQDAKKQAGEGSPSAARAAVVGAGFMGSGIAIPLVTKAKLPTALKEANLEVLGRALKKVRGHLDKAVAKRKLTPVQAAAGFNLLAPGAEAQDLRRVDFVIEAVPEVLEIKHAVFAELEALVPEAAVLGSNTSTLPIADIAAKARHPERFVGMHFFSPAEVMPLVEVIPGPRSSPKTVAAAVDLALRMGKTPVVVKDSPGFLVNRILLPYILEATQLVAEGVDPRTVDSAALEFGMPVGPIKLIGEVGVPVIKHVLGILRGAFGDHLPAPDWVNREDLASAFPRGADGRLSVDAARIRAWVGRPDPGMPAPDLEDRLYLAMLNESLRAMDEGLVSDPGLLDLAMIYGTGFPPYKGGPLRLAGVRGLPRWADRADELARVAPWLKPCAAMRSGRAAA